MSTPTTVSNPVTGESITFENRLLPEDIKIGQLLWYMQATPFESWSCPGIITDVDAEHNCFAFVSFHTFAKFGDYSFDVDGNSGFIRQTMRKVELDEVKKYLIARGDELDQAMFEAAAAHAAAQKQVINFINRAAEYGFPALKAEEPA